MWMDIPRLIGSPHMYLTLQQLPRGFSFLTVTLGFKLVNECVKVYVCNSSCHDTRCRLNYPQYTPYITLFLRHGFANPFIFPWVVPPQKPLVPRTCAPQTLAAIRTPPSTYSTSETRAYPCRPPSTLSLSS